MGGHLVLAGGGHAHMTVMKRLRELTARGHRVTLVAPDPSHYYSGMGPGLLGGFYRPAEIRFNVRRMVEERGGHFVLDRVVLVDVPSRLLRLASGRTLGFDVASFNVGSGVPTSLVDEADRSSPDIVPVKPIAGLLAARRRLTELAGERGRGHPVEVAVVGGGPAGFEIAGNAWRAVTRAGGRPSVTVIAGSGLLAGLPRRARRLARYSLARRGISILEGTRAARVAPGRVHLQDGRDFPFDLAFLCLGVRPPALFADSGLPVGPEGGLLVNRYLQAEGCPDIFGGGDCIHFGDQPLDKVGVFAVRENPVLMANLLARLEGTKLTPFDPGGGYLLVYNCGDSTGILVRGFLVLDGRLAFRVKDMLDRAFMHRFQVSGEREGQGSGYGRDEI